MKSGLAKHNSFVIVEQLFLIVEVFIVIVIKEVLVFIITQIKFIIVINEVFIILFFVVLPHQRLPTRLSRHHFARVERRHILSGLISFGRTTLGARGDKTGRVKSVHRGISEQTI
jgi:hypothetical protein